MKGIAFDPEEEEADDASDFLADYSLRHVADHLAAAGERERLFALLESTGHLARQAERFQGFELGVADLLDRALPAALAEADWPRFLRFAATALHLSGLAHGLAEPELLAAIARSGRADLAKDAAQRLPDPWLRVEALAAVAREVGAIDARAAEPILSVLRQTIEGTRLPPSEAGRKRAFGRLCGAARGAGPEIGERWPVWMAALTPTEAGTLRRELAEAWLARGDPAAEGLWRALAATDERDRPALARRLGEISAGQASNALTSLRRKLPERPIEIDFLVGLARAEGLSALPIARQLALGGPDFPDVSRVDEALPLLDLLPAEEVDRLAEEAPSGEARAALAAVALAREPTEARIGAARDAVERLDEPVARLDAALRFLAARPASPERSRQLAAVAGWMEEGRFAASVIPPASMRRFLDLAAIDLPSRAGGFLDGVAFAPGAAGEELFLLARELAAEPLLERLIDQAETYANAVAPHAGASFALRAEIRIEAAARFCSRRRDLRGLTLAAPLLLADEEDELRDRLARRWAPSVKDLEERERRAHEICDGIRNRKRQLLARIAALPPERFPSDALSSTALYASLAEMTGLESEIATLAALSEMPIEPAEVADHLLNALPRSARSSALLALAQHAIAFEEAVHGKGADRGTSLGLLRSTLVFDSDRALAEATPEIAALGAAGSPALTVLEIEEAARRLAGLVEISWPERRTALARLFAAFPRILGSEGTRAARQAKSVASSLALLPLSLDSGPARDELREGWASLAPVLTGAVERLPQPPEGFARALERGFGPISEPDRAVLEICLAGGEARNAQIDRALAAPAGEAGAILPTTEAAVLVLLAPLRPERAAALSLLWPAGEDRDGACLFLLRERWLNANAARAVAERVTEGPPRAEALAWATLSESDALWLNHLAAWISVGARGPGDPDLLPFLRKLWATGPTATRPILGNCFAGALRTGGRAAAEIALRWFLHAHLSPIFGAENPAAIPEITAARDALRRALRLPGDPDTTSGGASEP